MRLFASFSPAVSRPHTPTEKPEKSNMGCCHSGRIDYDHDPVHLCHFDMHRVVGRGAFGSVRVVQHKRSKAAYALKYINKQQCIKQKSVSSIIQERHLLEEVSHPFLVNLRYAFQDEENCFYVLDLMMGGDLRFHLNMKGCFPEHVVRFWVAEIACGLSYLHEQRIIHRDIKPDNILLDAAGHAHITDFNVAIHYSSRRRHTSVGGTMYYMAPEMLDPARPGYYWQVDWWSLGVVAYELLWHSRPFEGNSAEKLTRSVLSDPIAVPPRVVPHMAPVSRDGCSAVLSLLERNPHTRLACRSIATSLAEVKSHPWFSKLDWRRLERKELQPPYVPDQSRANFDVGLEMDDYMSGEKRLSSKRRGVPDLEKLSPEQRTFLEQFKLFDYERTPRSSYYPHNESIGTSAPPSVTGTYVGHSREHSPTSGHSAASVRTSSDRSSSSTRYAPSTHYAGPPSTHAGHR